MHEDKIMLHALYNHLLYGSLLISYSSILKLCIQNEWCLTFERWFKSAGGLSVHRKKLHKLAPSKGGPHDSGLTGQVCVYMCVRMRMRVESVTVV